MAFDEDASVEYHPRREVAESRRDEVVNARVESSRCAVETAGDKFNT